MQREVESGNFYYISKLDLRNGERWSKKKMQIFEHIGHNGYDDQNFNLFLTFQNCKFPNFFKKKDELTNIPEM